MSLSLELSDRPIEPRYLFLSRRSRVSREVIAHRYALRCASAYDPTPHVSESRERSPIALVARFRNASREPLRKQLCYLRRVRVPRDLATHATRRLDRDRRHRLMTHAPLSREARLRVRVPPVGAHQRSTSLDPRLALRDHRLRSPHSRRIPDSPENPRSLAITRARLAHHLDHSFRAVLRPLSSTLRYEQSRLRIRARETQITRLWRTRQQKSDLAVCKDL